jgi:hypothetical protein
MQKNDEKTQPMATISVHASHGNNSLRHRCGDSSTTRNQPASSKNSQANQTAHLNIYAFYQGI